MTANHKVNDNLHLSLGWRHHHVYSSDGVTVFKGAMTGPLLEKPCGSERGPDQPAPSVVCLVGLGPCMLRP